MIILLTPNIIRIIIFISCILLTRKKYLEVFPAFGSFGWVCVSMLLERAAFETCIAGN